MDAAKGRAGVREGIAVVTNRIGETREAAGVGAAPRIVKARRVRETKLGRTKRAEGGGVAAPGSGRSCSGWRHRKRGAGKGRKEDMGVGRAASRGVGRGEQRGAERNRTGK